MIQIKILYRQERIPTNLRATVSGQWGRPAQIKTDRYRLKPQQPQDVLQS